MKKWFYILFSAFIVLCFAGCGKSYDDKYTGEWVAVAWYENSNAASGRNVPAFEFNLKENGKGEIMLGIERKDLKWSADETSLSIKVNGDIYKAKTEENKLVFEDFMQTGLDITFALKSDVQADSEQYMSDTDKKMIGDWLSYWVEDVLGDDLSDTVQADGLFITFKSDYTADLKIEEIERKNEKWSMLDESWGSLDDTDCDLSWDIINDEIKVTYYTGKEFYIFYCKKIQKEI